VAPPTGDNNQENEVGAGDEEAKRDLLDLFESSDEDNAGGGKIVQGKQVRTGNIFNKDGKMVSARKVTATERNRWAKAARKCAAKQDGEETTTNRKHKPYKKGTRALMEIQKYQKSTDLLILNNHGRS
jgi:hypothetical protein